MNTRFLLFSARTLLKSNHIDTIDQQQWNSLLPITICNIKKYSNRLEFVFIEALSKEIRLSLNST